MTVLETATVTRKTEPNVGVVNVHRGTVTVAIPDGIHGNGRSHRSTLSIVVVVHVHDGTVPRPSHVVKSLDGTAVRPGTS